MWRLALGKFTSTLFDSGTSAQHHCSEQSTGFLLRLGSNTQLLAPGFSVHVRTICHHIFLIFIIHTIFLVRCALRTLSADSNSLLSWDFWKKKAPSLFFEPTAPSTLSPSPRKNKQTMFLNFQQQQQQQQQTLYFLLVSSHPLIVGFFLWPFQPIFLLLLFLLLFCLCLFAFFKILIP